MYIYYSNCTLFIPHAISCGGYNIFDPSAGQSVRWSVSPSVGPIFFFLVLSAQPSKTSQQKFVKLCILFFLGFVLSHSRIFPFLCRCHHCRWRAANFDLYSALMAIEQWGFLSVAHLLWHKWSSPRTSDIHTYWRAFGRGAVTTCFYDLGPSPIGFKHPTFRMRG